MIFFGALFTFIVIFISKIVETQYPYKMYNQYETVIMGIPICKYQKRGSFIVSITEKSHDYKKKVPVAGTIGLYNEAFYLIGSDKKMKKPHLYIKITHQCSRTRMKCTKLFIKEIPESKITGPRENVKVYNLGMFDLSGQPVRGSICHRRGRNIIPLD
uniref:Transthyretin-like family-containing protein n=1 Tax=Strongyloides venezuelensis TaxID=75913 RepID=A0A0K0FX15_STRVS